MAHFFVEPERLRLALAIAQWKNPPWYRHVSFDCDGCDEETSLIFVSTKVMFDEECQDLLSIELIRRGWGGNGLPWNNSERIDYCPHCVKLRSESA